MGKSGGTAKFGRNRTGAFGEAVTRQWTAGHPAGTAGEESDSRHWTRRPGRSQISAGRSTLEEPESKSWSSRDAAAARSATATGRFLAELRAGRSIAAGQAGGGGGLLSGCFGGTANRRGSPHATRHGPVATGTTGRGTS